MEGLLHGGAFFRNFMVIVTDRICNTTIRGFVEIATFWKREGVKIILLNVVIIRTRMASLTKEKYF